MEAGNDVLWDLFRLPVPVDSWREEIEATNYALQHINRFVVANREKFGDADTFNLMLQLYVNVIGIVAGEKRKVAELLGGNPVFSGLKNKKETAKLCSAGKYQGIQRALRPISGKSYMRDFLDLLEVFSLPGQYGEQARALERFIRRYSDARGNTIATSIFTGILASLQPDEFMVYNTRARALLAGTAHSRLSEDVDLGNYMEFNEVYRSYRDRSGKSLIDLDILLNSRYWETM